MLLCAANWYHIVRERCLAALADLYICRSTLAVSYAKYASKFNPRFPGGIECVRHPENG